MRQQCLVLNWPLIVKLCPARLYLRIMNKILAIRIVAVFIVVILVRNFIPENLNGFPYGGAIQARYKSTYAMSTMANFDGVHYVKIASEGYKQFNQAFFPLYPMLIKLFAIPFNNNHVLAGIAISISSFFAGCILLNKLLTEKYGRSKAMSALLFLLVFPTSFFFKLSTQRVYFCLRVSLFCMH